MKNAIEKASGVTRGGGRAGLRWGFTLIEMLVVVGILVILAALLLPMIRRAQVNASKARVVADLQTIGVGLDSYKQDYGSYPLTDRAVSGTGSQLLALTMIAPGPAVQNTAAATSYPMGTFVTVANVHYMAQKTTATAPTATDPDWRVVPMPYWDGEGAGPGVDGIKPGPGFRIRPVLAGTDGVLGTADDIYSGKAHGAYLDASRFRVGLKMQILDSFGNPILYFPAKPGRANITVPSPPPAAEGIKPEFPKSGNVKMIVPRRNYVDYAASAVYDLRDNFGLGLTQTITDLTPTEQWPTMYLRQTPSDDLYLGAAASGSLQTADVKFDKVRLQVQHRLEAAGDFVGGYILWSAGPDGWFFTEDDATNFVAK